MKKNNQETYRAIVESPKGSKLKFDYDPEQGMFVLNKLMPAGLVFPFDFGYLPATLGADGDPLDAIVISEFETFPGCAVDCRLIGVIKAVQKEQDNKQLRNDRFLLIPNISAEFKQVEKPTDLPKVLLKEIQSFFINYNQQAGKTFRILGLSGPAGAAILLKKSKQGKLPIQELIQVFLPLEGKNGKRLDIVKIEAEFSQKFGGVSTYRQSPVSGKWLKDGRVERDELLVIEVLAGSFDTRYWSKFRSSLEKSLGEQEILIRALKTSVSQ